MIVAFNLSCFSFMCIAGIVALIVAICMFIEDCFCSLIATMFTILIFLFGFGCFIGGGICIIEGLSARVDFTMKNADGTIIEKTVTPFEYVRDGNCFRFEHDDTHYCGWEVQYKYRK